MLKNKYVLWVLQVKSWHPVPLDAIVNPANKKIVKWRKILILKGYTDFMKKDKHQKKGKLLILQWKFIKNSLKILNFIKKYSKILEVDIK